MSIQNLETILIDQPNARAEDGFQQRGSWNSFCEGILIPLGSLFAVFLVMVGLMLAST
jgi:hypothetical protein